MRLYLKYFEIHLKSAMQFKGSFITTLISQFLTSFTVFLGITFMFGRFHLPGVILCYAIMLMGFSLSQLLASGFKVFDTMIANGQFDRILCRPRNEIFQVLAQRVDFVRLGMLFQAVVMLIYGLMTCPVDWDPLRVLTVILMIIGGFVLFSALFLLDGSIAFCTLQRLLDPRGALRPGAVLPPDLCTGPLGAGMVHVPAGSGLPVRGAMLGGLAHRRAQVQVNRFLKGEIS